MKATIPLPPPEIILNTYRYDPDIGEFTRANGRRGTVGNLSCGELYLPILGGVYRADKVVWYLTRGAEPSHLHIANTWEHPEVCLPDQVFATPRVVPPFQYDKTQLPPLPDLGWLNARFIYNPSTGRVHHRRNGVMAKEAGGIPAGVDVRCLNINGTRYKEDHVVWGLHHGHVPDHLQVDHLPGRDKDNHIEALILGPRAPSPFRKSKATV